MAEMWKNKGTFAPEIRIMYKRGTTGKGSDRPKSDKKPFNKSNGSKTRSSEGASKRPYGTRSEGSSRDETKKPFGRSSAPRGRDSERPSRDEGKRPYGKSTRDDSKSFDKAPRRTRPFGDDKPAGRNYSDRKPAAPRSNFRDKDDSKSFDRTPRKTRSFGDDKPAGRNYSDRKPAGPRSNFRDKDDSKSFDRTPRKTRSFGDDKPAGKSFGDSKPRRPRIGNKEAPKTNPYNRTPRTAKPVSEEKPSKFGDRKASREERPANTKADGTLRSRSGRGPSKSDLLFDKRKAQKDDKPQSGNIRLNRYIANAGVCSRREADDLILAGVVTVNGKAVEEMGYQVKPSDEVRYNGQLLNREKKVYLLLNKPKDAITTFEDPEGRRTVMQLFGNELGERIYPVGRLDRNTTGVLLFTNDGDVAQRLTHPRYEMTKVYKATLDKVFKGEDLWQLQNGVELEDGFIKPDAIAIPDPKNKNEVGVEIHSGKNRIIHRMFEHLGYKVDKLDRALYAGLTKGKLKRGEWRHLTEKELNTLKRTLKLS
jgi:23S rRNA pseudouridine2605 synthase